NIYSLLAGGASQNCWERSLGAPPRLEPRDRGRKLAESLDRGIRNVVARAAAADLDHLHVRQPRALDVESRVVAHVHGVLRRAAEDGRGLTKEAGVRLAAAALIRDPHPREVPAEAGVGDDLPQHDTGCAQDVGHETDAKAAFR